MDDANDEEWLRLYTHNFNVTSMRRSHCFLSPEAMMSRIDVCDIPVTPRDIPALVRKLQCKFGTAIIDDPSAPDADQGLCGQIRAVPTVLITDMMYHTRSNQKRANNLESGLQNAMGNPDFKVFQPPWDHMWDADYTGAFKEGLDYVKAAIASGKNPFVIIWLSFTCMVREGTQILTGEASFTEDLIKIMKEIQEVSGSPIFVSLLGDAAFHGSKANLQNTARQMRDELNKTGILCALNSMILMWRGAYAMTGNTMYHFVQKVDRDVIWAHLDWHLLRQKILIACSMDWNVVAQLNELATYKEKNGLNSEAIRRCTSEPTIRTNGNVYSSSPGLPRKVNAGGNLAAELLKKRSIWTDIQLGSHLPTPTTPSDEYWIERIPGNGATCDKCDVLSASNPMLWLITENKASCCNCAANAGNQHNGFSLGEDSGNDEIYWLAKLAAKLKWMTEKYPEWNGKHARDDMIDFMVTSAKCMLTDHYDGLQKWKADLLKQVSHYGGVRVASHLVSNNIVQKHCAAFTCRKQMIVKDGRRRIFFQLIYDGGNVAYADYVKKILSREGFWQICGNTSLSAEMIGDIFEFWMGMFMLGSVFPDILSGWGTDLGGCLRGLEESFCLFVASSRGTRTVNTKRKNRPPQVEWDHEKEERALKVLTELNVFQRIANGEITLMDYVPDEEDPTVEIDDEENADGASENASFTFTKEGEEEEDGDDDVNVSPDQEGQDTAMESQEETEREQKRRRITDMIDRMREQADIDGICLACGEEGHNADICDKDRNVSDTLDKMREMFKPQEKPAGKSQKTKKSESKKRDIGAGAAGKRLLENEIFTQFEEPVLMTTIGDNEEGGEYLVNHVDTGEFGPKNITEMEELIDMAIERSKLAILPDIGELMDDTHTHNNQHRTSRV